MKYSFKRVSIKDVDKYANKKGVFRQTSMWANLKKFFRKLCINGYDEEGNVVFSCLMLRFYLPIIPYSVCYAPNGFVCDYNNTELIKSFTEYFNTYMKKHFIAYALFDPEIVKNIDFNEHEKNKYIHQQMLSYGYVHEQKNAYQYMQINNNYRLLFDYNQSNLEEEIFNHFDKKLQYDINLCKSRGVSIEKYSGIQYTKDTKLFDTFYDLFLETSERKHFGIKKENFYKQMLYNLKDYSYIYLAKYNYEIDYQNTNKLIIDTKNKIKELEESNNKKSNNKIKELTENIASYQKRLESIDQYKNANPYIGAAYFILIGEQSYYLLGANSKELRFTKPTSLLVWEMIRDSIKNKVISYNLGGSLTFKTDKIEDDPMYNVYNFKKQLSGELVEYYGDYYLINNKKIYQFWEKKNRLLKRLNSRF